MEEMRPPVGAIALGPTPIGASATEGLDAAFFADWNAMAARLNADPLAMAAVAHAETGMRPGAFDPRSNAGGLIGFMPSILQGLGWSGTPEAFRELSAREQIPYVERYYRPYAGYGLTNPGIVYAFNFLPARAQRVASQGDAGVLTQAGENYYDVNRILDRNSDGVITIGDLRQHLAIQNHGARWNAIVAGVGSRPGPALAARAASYALPIALATAALGAYYLYATTDGAALRRRAERGLNRLMPRWA